MGIGMKELVIILLVALVIFGAKKLRTVGSDLGHAVKGFKNAMKDGEDEENKSPPRQIRSEGADAEFPEAAKAPASEQKSDRQA